VVNRVLLIAFQYPPLAGTSGVQRALRFSQYLPEFGWEAIVLTADPKAYPVSSPDQMADIPEGMPLARAFALDTARHLSLFGKYPGKWAQPDRWVSWWLGAYPKGLSLIRRYRPDVIWSTFPIATAHMIGRSLHRATGVPWVADFRDVMTEDDYPGPNLWARWRALEDATVRACSRAVFTTEGAAQMYRERYADCPPERFAVIENGYDEQVFQGLAATHTTGRCSTAGKSRLRFVHSGIIYPAERDPAALFEALRELRADGLIDAEGFRLVLRATGHDEHLRALIERMQIQELVELVPGIPYRDALEEMTQADALVVLQGASCNRQIPAKVYEYLRCGRPILGLAEGDTARLLRGSGVATVAPLESKEAIKALFAQIVPAVRNGTAAVPPAEAAERHSRRAKTQELAQLMRHLVPDAAASKATAGG